MEVLMWLLSGFDLRPNLVLCLQSIKRTQHTDKSFPKNLPFRLFVVCRVSGSLHCVRSILKCCSVSQDYNLPLLMFINIWFSCFWWSLPFLPIQLMCFRRCFYLLQRRVKHFYISALCLRKWKWINFLAKFIWFFWTMSRSVSVTRTVVVVPCYLCQARGSIGLWATLLLKRKAQWISSKIKSSPTE